MRLDRAAGTEAPGSEASVADEAPGDEASSPASAGAPAPARRPDRTDLALALLIPAIFVANLAVSLALETDGIWRTSRWQGYSMNLYVTVLGVYLVAPPLIAITTAVDPRSDLAYYAGTGWWALAWVSIVLIVTQARSVPMWRRVLYAYLIGAQVAGFAAVHWSTAFD